MSTTEEQTTPPIHEEFSEEIILGAILETSTDRDRENPLTVVFIRACTAHITNIYGEARDQKTVQARDLALSKLRHIEEKIEGGATVEYIPPGA